MISEAEIEEAVNFLESSAVTAAMKRAERIYLEEYKKTVKATVMLKYADASVAAQERNALASREYQDILSAMKTAIEEDEKIRFLRIAAEAKIEAWRSLNANYRAIKV